MELSREEIMKRLELANAFIFRTDISKEKREQAEARREELRAKIREMDEKDERLTQELLYVRCWANKRQKIAKIRGRTGNQSKWNLR